MLIRHFVRQSNIPVIQKSGIIQLEGTNFPALGMPGNSMYERGMCDRGKLPRLVWLTKANDCKTADGTGMVKSIQPFVRVSYPILHAFECDSDDVAAVPWIKYKRKFTNSKKTWNCINILDMSARFGGDDPDDYYVCEQPIDLSKCKLVVINN